MMKRSKNIILIWLILSAFFVISTIVIGGYTRLANAGLSIVEWKPITGIFLPITDSSWDLEFNKYKASPEYQDINIGMSIEEFKTIYKIEYIHRIVGRLVAIIFIVPFIIFWIRKSLSNTEINLSIIISFLVLLQGGIGWYMVNSGIADMPYVSHFRLALHLIIATIIYSLIFWLICKKLDISNIISENRMIFVLAKIGTLILLVMILCQIFFGGLVAGSKAGFVYNTFPRMAGRLIPPEMWNFTFSIENLSNVLYIQFLHRLIAYIIGLFSFIYSCYMIICYRKNAVVVFSTLLLLFSVFCQIILGIMTLLLVVPVELALFHQFFSIVVISSTLWNLSVLNH